MISPFVPPPSDDIVLQYFAGKLSGMVAEEVRRYFETSPELSGVHAGLLLAMQTNALQRPPDADAGIARLLQRIELERAREQRRTIDLPAGPTGASRAPSLLASRDRSSRRYGGWAIVVAACIVAVIASAGFGRKIWFANSTAVVMRELATQRGQRMTMQLADGSSVTLAPQSRLKLSPAFGRDDRTVVLEGEAYFDVTSSNAVPFVVRTNHSEVRVLGTAFDVRAYDTVTTVAVVTGKVALTAGRASAPSLIVTANHVGVIEPDGDARVRQDDMTQYAGWMHGRLVFRNTPLPDVLDRLNRWYGVRISVGTASLADRRLYAEWWDPSLEGVLQLLSDALGARITRAGDQITLYAR